MKIKDNDYYKNLYVSLLKAYDIKQNHHDQIEWYNIFSKIYKYDYKKFIYGTFNNYGNIEDFGFQFNSEEELLINVL